MTMWSDLQKPCPLAEGTRVRMVGVMPNDPCPVEVGTEGTVRGGNGLQIDVEWDNGRSLFLLPDDPYTVIDG